MDWVWVTWFNHPIFWTLLEWEPTSDRMIKTRFNSKRCKLTIILCYAPTSEFDKEDNEDWYEQL